MIKPLLREEVAGLICEAVKSGARLAAACKEIGINIRTYQRWQKSFKELNRHVDKCTIAIKPTPHNKLTTQEEQRIIEVVNQPEFSHLPPSQIIPILADRGIYIASESTFYRVLKKYTQQNYRGRSKESVKRAISTHKATKPNQVYT